MPIFHHFNQRTVQGPQGYQGVQGSNGVQGVTGGGAVSNGTSIGAVSATYTTSVATTGTSWQTLTGDPSVTATTGTSALVMISASFLDWNYEGYISFSVNDDMTAATLDARSIGQTSYGASYTNSLATFFLVTGLTPGSNKFTMVFKTPVNGYTQHFFNKTITVIPY